MAVNFELRSGATWRDPFPMYKELRDHDPVHHVGAADFYVLTRFADVEAAAGDSATFSSAQGLTVNYGEIEAAGLGDAMPMVFLDPPDHTVFRARVTRKLTPRRVADIEPLIRDFVVARLEKMRATGQRRHRRRVVQTAAQLRGRPLSGCPGRGPPPLRSLDRGDRAGGGERRRAGRGRSLRRAPHLLRRARSSAAAASPATTSSPTSPGSARMSFRRPASWGLLSPWSPVATTPSPACCPVRPAC